MRNLGLIGVWFSVLVGIPTAAFAHEIVTDAPISALLHVSPNDHPFAGEASTLVFEFMEPRHQFELANCDCRLTISNADKEIYNQPLPPPLNGLIVDVPFIFPSAGVYQAVVTGEAKDEAAFSDFHLAYEIEVAKEVLPWYRRLPHHSFHVFVAGLFAGVVFSLIIWENFKKFIAT